MAPNFYSEDVTGAGKTEAALILAHRLMAAGKAQGLYFDYRQWRQPTRCLNGGNTRWRCISRTRPVYSGA